MIRILFVDDEPRLLEGLQRMLRPHRREWDMQFAGSADEALGLMERAPVDVVVTDMRMPGLDGARLLEVVHQRYPGAMRIILSGQFDVESGLRAVPVAHQFLTKPCDPQKLKAVIESSSRLHATMADDCTRRIVAAIGALPSPPKTCVDLMAALENPDVSLEAIVRIVGQDVAVAAKVLQLANSAFFSLPHPVSSIKAAVNFLGLEVLRQLVISAGILHAFQPARLVRGFSVDEFDRHSKLTAQIASALWARNPNRSTGVMAALLHDTGRLVLASRLPAKLEAVLEEAAQGRRPLAECEVEAFGTSHAQIGAYLLGLWGLPAPVVDAVSHHHQPGGAETPAGELSLRGLVHVSDALADEAGKGGAKTDAIPAGMDDTFLNGIGLHSRIPEWREIARQSRTGK